jgi:ElaB/YqjD/DUF883 family membrane-anchored ribosome-binding protein
MEHKTGELERAKGRIANDLKALVGDGQELLKATASASGERIDAVRTQFAAHASSATRRLAELSRELSRPLVERAGRVDDYVRYYVRANPWAALAVTAAAGMLLGLLAAKR